MVQGWILGPLLFIIYMNDLPNSVEGTKIKMYVDDTNLTIQITSLGDVKEELIPESENIKKYPVVKSKQTESKHTGNCNHVLW